MGQIKRSRSGHVRCQIRREGITRLFQGIRDHEGGHWNQSTVIRRCLSRLKRLEGVSIYFSVQNALKLRNIYFKIRFPKVPNPEVLSYLPLSKSTRRGKVTRASIPWRP